jgi:DNA transformation protein
LVSWTLDPMKFSAGFKDYVLDQLEDLGGITARAMFGGLGLYSDGLFFGIIADDVLYLKVDDTNRSDYESAGMGPFKPYAHRPTTMKYYAVPLEVLESREDIVAWARRSLKVAARHAR